MSLCIGLTTYYTVQKENADLKKCNKMENNKLRDDLLHTTRRCVRPSGRRRRRRRQRPVPREDREPGFAVAECSEVPSVPKNVVLYRSPVAEVPLASSVPPPSSSSS